MAVLIKPPKQQCRWGMMRDFCIYKYNSQPVTHNLVYSWVKPTHSHAVDNYVIPKLHSILILPIQWEFQFQNA